MIMMPGNCVCFLLPYQIFSITNSVRIVVVGCSKCQSLISRPIGEGMCQPEASRRNMTPINVKAYDYLCYYFCFLVSFKEIDNFI